MKSDKKTSLIFLAPTIIISICLIIYPVIRTFMYSLYSYKFTEPNNISFKGLDNYKEVLLNPDFHNALINTVIVVATVIFIGIIFSLVVAIILNQKTKFNEVLMAIAITPWALPPIVNGIVWKFIFHSGFGFLNKLFFTLHLIKEPIKWLDTQYGTLIIMAFIVSWRIIPFCAIILLANMQSISKEIYDVSDIDGANSIQKFKAITLPLLVPSINVVLINLIMVGINTFDEAVALVGYRTSTQTVSTFNYTQTITFANFGFGSSVTYLIMLGSALVGYYYIKNLNKGGAY